MDEYKEKYNVVVCNPPFGSKIVEKRSAVLKNYQLAYEWTREGDYYVKSEKLMDKQETGILFVEACIKECKKRGE